MPSIASLPTVPAYRPSSDALSDAGRAAHDVGAAALLGGNLFARVAMHPALADVCAPRERGIVTNRAWRRYGAVNGVSLAAVLAGWGVARGSEASDDMLDPVERRLARAKDAAVVAVAVTGLASAVEGIRFARSEPDGAVPLADGDTPAPEATPREARMKRVLKAVGTVNLAAEVALVAINATLAQRTFRRPPKRRLLAR
jgi:hypothetical protein